MIARMPTQPSRRVVVRAGGLGAVLLGLSACGIRLESDAPRIPLVPTRTPRPGEAGLQALLDNGAAILAACAAWTGPGASPAATLGGIVRAQDTTLAALLVQAGAPTTSATATATPSGPVTPPATATTGGSAAATGRVAADAARTLAGLASIEADLVPTVVSVLASRVAWGTVLGQPDSLASLTAPARPTATPTAAPVAGWLQATWAAQYAFQVVTARSAGEQRLRGLRCLDLLDRTETGQRDALATTAPPEPIGFDLPFPVTDAASARRLAVHAAEGLRTAYAAQLGRPVGADPILDPARWLSVAERLVIGWGGKAEPFPGLVA